MEVLCTETDNEQNAGVEVSKRLRCIQVQITRRQLGTED